MNHAIEEIGNFDYPGKALPGGTLDVHRKEIFGAVPDEII